jgi:uroporphyrinogen decarboxylase
MEEGRSMGAMRDRGFWDDFWAANNASLFGSAYAFDNRDPRARDLDELPIRPAYSMERPQVPVLVELGEDWIIGRTGAEYRRYILDFEYQSSVRRECEALLLEDIGFRLRPKVDTASLLHGSIYGNPIEYPPDSTPWLGHVLRGPADVKRLIERMEREELAKAGLVPEFVRRYRALGRPYFQRILHDPTSVHGPGTILGFLFGINDFALFIYDEPDLAKELLSLVARITVAYSKTVRTLVGAPAAGVGVFDDVAGLLSPGQFEEFLLPVYEAIYGELAPGKDDDRFLHNDAAVGHLLPYFRALGVNGINPDPKTPPGEIRRQLPGAIIYGCVPPLLLKDGSPEAVYEAARESIAAASGLDGGLVLTTAGSMNMGTPYENLEALCRAAADAGRGDSPGTRGRGARSPRP